METFASFLLNEGFFKSAFNRVKKVTKATQTIANFGGSPPRVKKRAAWSTKPKAQGVSRNKMAIDREKEAMAKIKQKISPDMMKLKASREKIKRMKSSWL